MAVLVLACGSDKLHNKHTELQKFVAKNNSTKTRSEADSEELTEGIQACRKGTRRGEQTRGPFPLRAGIKLQASCRHGRGGERDGGQSGWEKKQEWSELMAVILKTSKTNRQQARRNKSGVGGGELSRSSISSWIKTSELAFQQEWGYFLTMNWKLFDFPFWFSTINPLTPL